MFKANPSPALHRLLDEGLQFPPEYHGNLSSHLPMALVALEGIGADEPRMRTFFTLYAQRFAAPAPRLAIKPVSDWPILRGRFDAFEPLRSTFAVALEHEGRDAVLSGALPLLVTGIGAAAFHGAIRVAYAVESRHNGELAAALAYWAARWMPLQPPELVEPDIDNVTVWLDAIDGRKLRDEAGWRWPSASIDERMRSATQTTAYRAESGRLRTCGRNAGLLLAELALAAAARYAATRDFTVLHIATAARAARVLMPWLPKDNAALAPLWHAVAAASLTSDTAWESSGERSVSALDWRQVLALARASDHEHVIKLVHAMAVQHAAAPDPGWLQAAAKAVSEEAATPIVSVTAGEKETV